MESIKVKCPAKINLTLEVLNKRDDGYHNIKSVMQMVSLYDYLTIKLEHAHKNGINLYGTTPEIPYDSKNLVYKAAECFLRKSGIKNLEISIYIEKNIPISAGLAGGSTDAAGTIWGLNKLLQVFNQEELHNICAELGSDLNVCLNGGCNLATSRGEIIQNLGDIDSAVTIIKPKKLGISAKEAYQKYSAIEFKPNKNMTEKIVDAINTNQEIKNFLWNDLEYAVFNDYEELQTIKQVYPQAVMSGSGSAYYVLDNIQENKLGKDYLLINNLRFITEGVNVCK